MSLRLQLHQRLPKLWRQRSLVTSLLFPLALLFQGSLQLRRWACRIGLLKVGTLPVPVVVVGNIIVGGSGKTPLVVWLFEALRAAGKKPGIISRGYGGTGSAAGMLVNADTPAAFGGDEPCLLAKLTEQAVAIGRDRVAAAELFLRHFPECDVLISDDGLQHIRLPRQFEIVVFDTRGIGNSWLLPAGPLREPLNRLCSVDALVFNGNSNGNLTDGSKNVIGQFIKPGNRPAQFQMQLEAQDAYQLIDPTQRRSLASFTEQRILAAAGIGDPARFFSMLQNHGMHIEALPLPDHYDFSSNPFTHHPAQVILMTEKDAVKCRTLKNLQDPRIWVVPVRAIVQPAVADAPDLVADLLEKLSSFV